MVMNTIRCPVLGAPITQVSDFEGRVTRVICKEYDASNGSCRLKKSTREGGLLSQFLERVSEDTLGTRSTLCVMRTA